MDLTIQLPCGHSVPWARRALPCGDCAAAGAPAAAEPAQAPPINTGDARIDALVALRAQLARCHITSDLVMIPGDLPGAFVEMLRLRDDKPSRKITRDVASLEEAREMTATARSLEPVLIKLAGARKSPLRALLKVSYLERFWDSVSRKYVNLRWNGWYERARKWSIRAAIAGSAMTGVSAFAMTLTALAAAL